MLRRVVNWLKSKLAIVKPGIDIEVVGKVAIIRIDCGRMPPTKAQDFTEATVSKLFTAEVKALMNVEKIIAVPYFRS